MIDATMLKKFGKIRGRGVPVVGTANKLHMHVHKCVIQCGWLRKHIHSICKKNRRGSFY